MLFQRTVSFPFRTTRNRIQSHLSSQYTIHRSRAYQRPALINENFFNGKIDTPAKAWFLGWALSDGCVMKGATTNIQDKFNISLQLGDIDVLEKIKHLLGTDLPIAIAHECKGHRRQPEAILRITSNSLCHELSELGCIPHKCYSLEYPEAIVDEVSRHFARGFFEGDGHIGLRASGYPTLGWSSSSKPFLEKLMQVIRNNCELTKHEALYPLRNMRVFDAKPAQCI